MLWFVRATSRPMRARATRSPPSSSPRAAGSSALPPTRPTWTSPLSSRGAQPGDRGRAGQGRAAAPVGPGCVPRPGLLPAGGAGGVLLRQTARLPGRASRLRGVVPCSPSPLRSWTTCRRTSRAPSSAWASSPSARSLRPTRAAWSRPWDRWPPRDSSPRLAATRKSRSRAPPLRPGSRSRRASATDAPIGRALEAVIEGLAARARAPAPALRPRRPGGDRRGRQARRGAAPGRHPGRAHARRRAARRGRPTAGRGPSRAGRRPSAASRCGCPGSRSPAISARCFPKRAGGAADAAIIRAPCRRGARLARRSRSRSGPLGARSAATPALARKILDILEEAHPEARCALDYRNPFELSIATILSAQCTDERVNQVTPLLFERFPTAQALAEADAAEVEPLIRSTGFFRAKARSIIGFARGPGGASTGGKSPGASRPCASSRGRPQDGQRRPRPRLRHQRRHRGRHPRPAGDQPPRPRPGRRSPEGGSAAHGPRAAGALDAHDRPPHLPRPKDLRRKEAPLRGLPALRPLPVGRPKDLGF